MGMARQLSVRCAGALRRGITSPRFLPSLDACKNNSSCCQNSKSIIAHSLAVARSMTSERGGDRELLRILKDEIEHEKQANKVSQGEATKPPEPFTIDDKPGAQEVFLFRPYNHEDVKLTCLYQTQPYSDGDNEDADEGEDAPAKLVQITVKVSKKGDDPYLEIQCVTTGDEPVIEHVSYKDDVKGVKDLAYEGPQFSDLDGEVQKGFQKYMKDRGVNAELGSFLVTYMCNKEQQEYYRWLQNVEDFVKK